MTFDRGVREQRGARDVSSASTGVPGKATLTQKLAAEVASSSPVQAKAAPPIDREPHASIESLFGGAVQRAARDPVHSAPAIHEAAERGMAAPATSLPHATAIQQSFGPAHDISHVQAHVGGAAGDACRDMNATAYAAGAHIAFAGAPDLHTAAHEAAHVVQQAQGVNLYGGVGEAGDVYERHADAVADRVVAGESAADLLSSAPSSSAATAGPRRGAAVQRQAAGSAAAAPATSGSPPPGGPGGSEAQVAEQAQVDKCVAILRWMIQHGTATPEAVAKLVQDNPGVRELVLAAARQEPGLPADFVDQVNKCEQALPPTPHAPDISGKTGSPFAGNAAASSAKPYSDGVLLSPDYRGTDVPVNDPNRVVAGGFATNPDSLAPDPASTPSLATGTITTKQGGTTTTATTNKEVAQDVDNIVDQANAVRDYRAKVNAALDEQIAGVNASTRVAGAEGAKAKQEMLDQLNAAKAKATDAKTVADLDQVVASNKLLVIPPEALLKATTTTTTRTASGGALLDGSNVFAAGTKTVTYDANDPLNPGKNMQTTNAASVGIGIKGIDASASTSTTKTDQDSGASNTTTWKAGITGGITDPLQAGVSRKTDTGEVSVTAKAADGTGSVSLGGKTLKADGTPDLSGSATAGVTQGAAGTGLTAGVEGRRDTGDKDTSRGVYGAADGSISVLVTGDDDHGYTLTFTASSRIKVGDFLGKRQPDKPTEVGKDTSYAGGASLGHNHVVTRTKKLSPAEMKSLFPDLDNLASGHTADGKKTFGVKAAYAAYTRVFGGHLDDLFGGDVEAGKGESISVADETTAGLDAKAGASTGDSKSSRGSLDASLGAEHDWISGVSEKNDGGVVTRSIRTGTRDKASGSVSGGFGGAAMKVGGSYSDENTRTYIFHVREDNAALLAEMRAIKTPDQAEQFAKAHPETVTGNVAGSVTSTGNTVGASLGPVATNIGTTHTIDQNIASTSHKDADGKEVKDLSGTIGGKLEGTADASVFGVKLYQEKTTAESKGTVDTDGQAALDVTTTTSSSNAYDAWGKNKADLAAISSTDKALIVATGGPLAYVKRLAERVGEQNTIGAHFDNASFDTVVALAGDHDRWMKAADTYRAEWSHLGNQLTHPSPPASWLDQDESPDKHAAYQLARMKAFAEYMSEAGPKGTETVQRLRSQFNGDDINALGATVSWPPSLQSQRGEYDKLAGQVEHLQPTMQPYAERGDRSGGDAYLDDLLAKLEPLKIAIANAPDHENAAKAVQAATGVNQMQDKVRKAKERFHAALDAKAQNKTKAEIDAAFAEPKKESKRLYDDQEDLKKQIAERDREAAAKPLPARGDDKGWAEHDRALVDQGGTPDEQAKLQALRDQENKAREDEAVAEARDHLQTFHETCIQSRDNLFGVTSRAVALLPKNFLQDDKDAMAQVDQVRAVLVQWQANWKKYKDACSKTGTFPDMTVEAKLMGHMKSDLQTVHDAVTSEWNKSYVAKLLAEWG